MNAAPLLLDVLKRARALPSAPWLLPKLMEQLDDPDSAADQVEALIRLDAGLATGTLRLANSAYFNSAAPCDALSEAIVRLGFREVYRLATTSVASRWLSKEVTGYGWEPGDLYCHSLTVAVAADLLAKETGSTCAELAYTAGLLHDVGKLALAHTCSEHFEHVRELQAREDILWREAEEKIFGYDHTVVGGALLQDWGFPANLVQVAYFYSRPRLTEPEYLTLVAHVHAAKQMALCIGAGVGEDGFRSEVDEDLLRDEGITPEMTEALVPEVIERSAKLLRTEVRA